MMKRPCKVNCFAFVGGRIGVVLVASKELLPICC